MGGRPSASGRGRSGPWGEGRGGPRSSPLSLLQTPPFPPRGKAETPRAPVGLSRHAPLVGGAVAPDRLVVTPSRPLGVLVSFVSRLDRPPRGASPRRPRRGFGRGERRVRVSRVQANLPKNVTTLSGGSLGSCVDEERS